MTTGYRYERALADGRWVFATPMLFGNWRLMIGDQASVEDFYCYHDDSVMVAFAEWDGDGDPPGRWVRHRGSSRRREYDADGGLVREWVAS